ncbi:MAG: hypothetical protein JWQ87_969 [Candidatus Sulfotelmatobacter sp.]|nr:hypothetical protein [Candidatus Sulfotelmatobacter sp.]
MIQDSVFVFVLMPFDSDFDDVYRLGIKERAKSFDMLAERVDEQICREGILDRIYRQIDVVRRHCRGHDRKESQRVL